MPDYSNIQLLGATLNSLIFMVYIKKSLNTQNQPQIIIALRHDNYRRFK